jgi:Spermine/spermidine synthase domain/S-adenosylmethionine decarboxylase
MRVQDVRLSRTAQMESRPKTRIETSKDNDYSVNISIHQIISIVVSSLVVSYSIGKAFRNVLMQGEDPKTDEWTPSYFKQDDIERQAEVSSYAPQLPRLLKAVTTNYKFHQFAIPGVRSSSSVLAGNVEYGLCALDTYGCSAHGNSSIFADNNRSFMGSNQEFIDVEDENKIYDESPKTLQHVMVDIANVDQIFLDSTERLATALIRLVELTSQTLLSYHCHKMEPSGVSCVGILVKGHASFHTWPSEGVIMLDLFTTGSIPLIDIIPGVKNLFGIQCDSFSSVDMSPHLLWNHKLRGYRNFVSENINPEETDIGWMLGSLVRDKDRVISVQTTFQRIDIYDLMEPRYRIPDKPNCSNFNDCPKAESLEKDRIVFLDGVIQSRRYGEEAYHETLVHPAMFVHENPKRIAIIGGGEGATLREVLKHSTVEKVVMVEIDELMVNISKTHLPGWSDCGDIEGSTSSCFDDPRSEVYYEDAIQWFVDRFAEKGEFRSDDGFDVIIMDAL